MAYDQIAADAIRDAADANERTAGVLADIGQVQAGPGGRTHSAGCWRDYRHGDCLAARIRRTLTEGDHHAAA